MKRLWRILKWFGLSVAALVAVVLIVTAILSALASARLNQKIAALRAAGDPVSLADLAREPIPPEENAATYLERARSDVEAINTRTYAAEQELTPEGENDDDDRPPSPELIERMRAIWAEYPEAFGQLEQAANCDRYDPGLNFKADTLAFSEALLTEVQNARLVQRALTYRAAVQMADHQLDDALHTCVVNLRRARQIDQSPLFMSILVAMACRRMAIQDAAQVLQAGAVSAAASDELEAELAQHNLLVSYQECLRGERAYGIQSYRDLSEKIPGPVPSLPFFKNDECHYIDLMSEEIESTKGSYWDFYVKDLASRKATVGWMAGSILPSLDAARVAVVRKHARLETLRVLNAILRRQQAGDLPEPILEHLDLPAEATIDPFINQPLHVKKLADGWAVYAVGDNQKDDGGVEDPDNEGPDVGVGLEKPPKEVGEATEPCQPAPQ